MLYVTFYKLNYAYIYLILHLNIIINLFTFIYGFVSFSPP